MTDPSISGIESWDSPQTQDGRTAAHHLQVPPHPNLGPRDLGDRVGESVTCRSGPSDLFQYVKIRKRTFRGVDDARMAGDVLA